MRFLLVYYVKIQFIKHGFFKFSLYIVHDLANIISIVRLLLIDIHLQEGLHATLTHHNRGEIYVGSSGLGNRLIGTFGSRGR